MFIEGKPYLRTDQYKTRPRTAAFVVHGSETSADQDVGVAEIRQWHIKERGFRDVGYHYVIKRDGTIQMGRPLSATPAAVTGSNDEIVAVCLVGGGVTIPNVNSMTYTDKPNYTAAQYESLRALLNSLYVTYPTVDATTGVKGHRDYQECQDEKKYCPFFEANLWWNSQVQK